MAGLSRRRTYSVDSPIAIFELLSVSIPFFVSEIFPHSHPSGSTNMKILLSYSPLVCIEPGKLQYHDMFKKLLQTCEYFIRNFNPSRLMPWTETSKNSIKSQKGYAATPNQTCKDYPTPCLFHYSIPEYHPNIFFTSKSS